MALDYRMEIFWVHKGAYTLSPSVEEYLQRLRPERIGLTSLKPLSSSDAECAAMEKKVTGHKYRVGLSPRGKMPESSEDFSHWYGRIKSLQCSTALFIGGAEGLSPEFEKNCDELLCLSSLTLAHPVALLVLVEQLYRAVTILNGHPYHK